MRGVASCTSPGAFAGLGAVVTVAAGQDLTVQVTGQGGVPAVGVEAAVLTALRPRSGVRFYDPATGSFLSRDPIEAITRSPYAYVGGNPTNMIDPSGLWSIGIPAWVSPAAAAVGIDCFGPDCYSIAEQHPATMQGIADFAGGVLNGVTLGNGRSLAEVAAGGEDKVRWDSGTTFAGNLLGTAVLLPMGGSSASVAGKMTITFAQAATAMSVTAAAGTCMRDGFNQGACHIAAFTTAISWPAGAFAGRIMSVLRGDQLGVVLSYFFGVALDSDC